MFKSTSPIKLVDVTTRDNKGNITGRKGRPEFIVMLSTEAYAMFGGNLDAYRYTPENVDDCWAGQPGETPLDTTVYLKFTTEAECKAKLSAFLENNNG